MSRGDASPTVRCLHKCACYSTLGACLCAALGTTFYYSYFVSTVADRGVAPANRDPFVFAYYFRDDGSGSSFYGCVLLVVAGVLALGVLAYAAWQRLLDAHTCIDVLVSTTALSISTRAACEGACQQHFIAGCVFFGWTTGAIIYRTRNVPVQFHPFDEFTLRIMPFVLGFATLVLVFFRSFSENNRPDLHSKQYALIEWVWLMLGVACIGTNTQALLHTHAFSKLGTNDAAGDDLL